MRARRATGFKYLRLNCCDITHRNSRQRCYVRKDALRDLSKFTGKQLCQSLSFAYALNEWSLTTFVKNSIKEVGRDPK